MFWLINLWNFTCLTFPLCILITTVCCLRKSFLQLIRLDLMLSFVLHLDIEPASCCVCFWPLGFLPFFFRIWRILLIFILYLYRQSLLTLASVATGGILLMTCFIFKLLYTASAHSEPCRKFCWKNCVPYNDISLDCACLLSCSTYLMGNRKRLYS